MTPRKKLVLVVEDEPLVARALIRALERGGYEAVHALCVESALSYLDVMFDPMLVADPEVAAVVTDLHLTEERQLEGLDVVALCHDWNIPVVLCTGSPGDVPRLDHLDDVPKLTKPVDFSRVLIPLLEEIAPEPAGARSIA